MATIRLYAPGDVPTALLSNVTPQALDGGGVAGVSTFAARADHKHDDTIIKAYVNTQVASGIANRPRVVEFSINFGTNPVNSAKVLVTNLTGITKGQPIFVAQSGNVDASKNADEIEMDAFVCRGQCLTDGQLTVYVNSLYGPVTGIYKFVATYL